MIAALTHESTVSPSSTLDLTASITPQYIPECREAALLSLCGLLPLAHDIPCEGDKRLIECLFLVFDIRLGMFDVYGRRADFAQSVQAPSHFSLGPTDQYAVHVGTHRTVPCVCEHGIIMLPSSAKENAGIFKFRPLSATVRP